VVLRRKIIIRAHFAHKYKGGVGGGGQGSALIHYNRGHTKYIYMHLNFKTSPAW
jgi:hypothetical protein